MSNNRGGGDEGGNSSAKLFFSLSSYNRFRRCWSRRLERLQSSSSSPDPIRFRFSEISSALKKSGVLSPYWHRSVGRCTLSNEKVVICRRRDHREDKDLSRSHLLSLTSRSHHPALVKLLGASQSRDRSDVYLVYEDIPGATLRECLPKLSSWIWRMQVALDVARGLDYIHHHCGMVHNWLTSARVIVTEPNSNACIFLFGANDFRGNEMLEWPIGHVAPDVFWAGAITQQSDVYAFGVVILELISGKAVIEIREREKFVNLVETVREAICRGDHHEYSELDEETRRGRVMQIVDPQLHGSFPVDTAERLIRVALQCVELNPSARPEMASVAGDIQRLFSDSKVWQKKTMKSPTTPFTLSSSREENLPRYPTILPI